MSRTPLLATPLLALALLAPLGAQAADNGFYLGGSVGQANVDVNDSTIGFDEDDTGYKLFVGIRPIDLLAAEVSYTDFGKPSANVGPVRATADVKAASLFGLLYAPLPLPLVDLYVKAGFARIEQDVTSSSFRLDRTDTDFAWGVGGQLNFGSLAVRAEYERFKTDAGDPDFVSIGVAWTFL